MEKKHQQEEYVDFVVTARICNIKKSVAFFILLKMIERQK